MTDSEQKSKIDQREGITDGERNFIREIAQYYMDFLETNFHKRKLPKRFVQFKDKNNLLVGVNLDKYPSFRKSISKIIEKGLGGEESTIPKGKFLASIPSDLTDIIKLKLEQLERDPAAVLDCILREVAALSKKYPDEFDVAYSKLMSFIGRELKKTYVLPIINSIEKTLYNAHLADENAIFMMEENLTDVLLSLMDEEIASILKTVMVGGEIKENNTLQKIVTKFNIDNATKDFFGDLGVKDLFADLYELFKNLNILDKHELYLYLGEIEFSKHKYPIFYIPLMVEKRNNEFCVKYDNQLYINKKALEYVVQSYNADSGKHGTLHSCNERIIYLSSERDALAERLNSVFSEISDYFALDKKLDVRIPKTGAAKSLQVTLKNSCYLSVFDKSDEALVNDYEEILQLLDALDNKLADAFSAIINDFIYVDPISCSLEVANEWDDMPIPEKLNFASPIPLNAEQRQILSALQRKDCKYLAVEGPPGTGKSHTITAIVFYAILKNWSVLVLSDKKEALDVVESKITDTINRVRFDKKFQNPILRLGKIGNTYNKILSSSSLNNIKSHYSAIRQASSDLAVGIEKHSNSIKEDIETEIIAYDDISLDEIREYLWLEEEIGRHNLLSFEEIVSSADSDFDLARLRDALLKIKKWSGEYLRAQQENISILRNFSTIMAGIDKHTLENFVEFVQVLTGIKKSYMELAEMKKEKLPAVNAIGLLSEAKYLSAKELYNDFLQIKHPLFGFLFKGKKLRALNSRFRSLCDSSEIDYIHKNLTVLEDLLSFYCDLVGHRDDRIEQVSSYFKHQPTKNIVDDLISFSSDLEYLRALFKYYPETLENLGIRPDCLGSLASNRLLDLSEDAYANLLRFVVLRLEVSKKFARVPNFDFLRNRRCLEDLVTTQMTHIMDHRVISFYENSKNVARSLHKTIKNKLRFPKDEFSRLKEAFPCILSGIRDFAEYIPLEKDLFDLIIIDEASQVSIAQAFPAILRAKKILILGDRKQFSNVKAAHARSETNFEYLNRLRHAFKKDVSSEEAKLVKIGNFNIRTSILEFLGHLNNYEIQLKKHFRGYKELIGYSNSHFYQNSLEVMKIRDKPINEALRFTFISHDGKLDTIENTNALEIDRIIEELKRTKEEGVKLSVGIVTPHTNQQRLIVERIHQLPERDYFIDELKLKVMTFDTCQGEERDLIIYSMVASDASDKLWAIFPKVLGQETMEDNSIKLQRLNVGFSRAKECMHFILSKPIDNFTGSIGMALRHYENALQEAKKEYSAQDVDKNSPMEEKVLHWFYQTDFWLKNKKHINFVPQFDIGTYLKQLDKTYSHPKYRVDFLLRYTDGIIPHKIIIEYDGFQEHFKGQENVHALNYDRYYSEEDIYRQKILESYGYKFLRINKFNVGHDPVRTLNSRIEGIINEVRCELPTFVAGFHKTVESLQNGSMKECPKCHKVRELDAFKDDSLITGEGRICNVCKGLYRKAAAQDECHNEKVDYKCPKCGADMVLRKGRYGKFYGCTTYPRCRGTRRF